MSGALAFKLQLALSSLIGHCELELLNEEQLSKDQQQKLRRLIWQIRQLLDEVNQDGRSPDDQD